MTSSWDRKRNALFVWREPEMPQSRRNEQNNPKTGYRRTICLNLCNYLGFQWILEPVRPFSDQFVMLHMYQRGHISSLTWHACRLSSKQQWNDYMSQSLLLNRMLFIAFVAQSTALKTDCDALCSISRSWRPNQGGSCEVGGAIFGSTGSGCKSSIHFSHRPPYMSHTRSSSTVWLCVKLLNNPHSSFTPLQLWLQRCISTTIQSQSIKIS